MNIQESGEMYLETVLILSEQKQKVRAIDVGEYMGFSKPSVSRAMGLLKSGGFLTVERDGAIRLTPLGTEVANKIYDRHRTLTEYLVLLGVSPETASLDACKMEHDISDESFEAIKRHGECFRKQ